MRGWGQGLGRRTIGAPQDRASLATSSRATPSTRDAGCSIPGPLSATTGYKVKVMPWARSGAGDGQAGRKMLSSRMRRTRGLADSATRQSPPGDAQDFSWGTTDDPRRRHERRVAALRRIAERAHVRLARRPVGTHQMELKLWRAAAIHHTAAGAGTSRQTGMGRRSRWPTKARLHPHHRADVSGLRIA